jgi:hypothetical protein
MPDMVVMLQFTVLFVAAYWTVLLLLPLKAAHYDPQGRLVVRRIFLGNLMAGLVRRQVRRNGSNLVVDVEGQPAIVGGPVLSAAVVGIVVVPWVE